jgi:hypothetical protein
MKLMVMARMMPCGLIDLKFNPTVKQGRYVIKPRVIYVQTMHQQDRTVMSHLDAQTDEVSEEYKNFVNQTRLVSRTLKAATDQIIKLIPLSSADKPNPFSPLTIEELIDEPELDPTPKNEPEVSPDTYTNARNSTDPRFVRSTESREEKDLIDSKYETKGYSKTLGVQYDTEPRFNYPARRSSQRSPRRQNSSLKPPNKQRLSVARKVRFQEPFSATRSSSPVNTAPTSSFTPQGGSSGYLMLSSPAVSSSSFSGTSPYHSRQVGAPRQRGTSQMDELFDQLFKVTNYGAKSPSPSDSAQLGNNQISASESKTGVDVVRPLPPGPVLYSASTGMRARTVDYQQMANDRAEIGRAHV